MSQPAPVSVLLPTVRHVDVIDQVAAQLEGEDELLVICDSDDDPIAAGAAPSDADSAGPLPDGVRLVVAGEPEGCSGKANAIAAGMEAARHGRLVWTDDDFDHPPDWLATLRADYERHGPVTELPFFRGRDPLAALLEPLYVLNGTLGVYGGEKSWGGGVIFERDDLRVPTGGRRLDGAEAVQADGTEAAQTDGPEAVQTDGAEAPQTDGPEAVHADDAEAMQSDGAERDAEAVFVRELRRTVSDDGLLSEYLDVTPLRRVRTVGVGDPVRDTLERHVRFTEIVYQHSPNVSRASGLLLLVLAAACVLFPLPALALTTLFGGGLYALFGVRRWTFLLTYPSLLASVPLALYALGRQTFVWGGRRYRWHSKYDVEVVEE